MVEIEPVQEDVVVIPPSEERRLDAEAIEAAASTMTRVTAKMRLQELAKKLRKESEALARVEQVQQQTSSSSQQQPQGGATDPTPAAAATTQPVSPTSVATAPPPAVVSPSVKYTPIDKFAFDDGGYSGAFVTLYIDLPGVGAIPREKVQCNFTKESFDLIVQDLNDKSYRLFKDNLEKDINPDKSKIVVKAQKVLIKLAKVKGEYGSYDHWSKLTDNKKKDKKQSSSSSDPQASIMEMMKNMYDEGDDNMKKMIGETMMKQRRGELGGDGGMGDMMGGMGGMGDLGGMDDDDI
eukprot:CAMPEP_0168744924 /NCGR_PEP_ID=MMETSP0724-20121128/14346_1 /TAXON_ID=265536 /ORGANISM="Amphiprora sp., Strain CCMP467" /LENGTH=293 /DNA_ID=CAMNT_0008792607 /DNA_START=20 /DNA_END=901 /DNA_ORIENTATION=-